jgi:tartrate dehydratase beta subunit/fumarate hydratase class I family protein
MVVSISVQSAVQLQGSLKIDVVDFPAFIVVDDKGNDFFAETMRPLKIGIKPEN